MKVVLTIHHFPPNYSAGAEIYAFRLAGWLIRHGHEVEVVCVESITHQRTNVRGDSELEYKHEIYQPDEGGGISVWRLYFNLEQSLAPFRRSFDNPAIGEWFADFLRRERPDVVHINSCYLLSVSTIVAAKLQSLPTVVTLHDFWFVCPRITLLKPTGALCRVPENVAECAWCLATAKRRFRWPEILSRGMAGAIAQRLLVSPPAAGLLGIQPDADELAYRRELLMRVLGQVDLILSPSEFLRDIFIEQGIDPVQILYSRLGLDTSHWIAPSNGQMPAGQVSAGQMSASDRESSQELRIGYIGQLAPHKGVHLLLGAFNRLVFSSRGARLTIYGDSTVFPDYVRSLRQVANGHPAVKFAGRFDNRRVAEILNETDVIVAPSIWYENSPITIMEALTTGTPVVAANLGGMPELVQHNLNGLLFEAGDIASLASQLQRLLDEPGLVDALAVNAHPVRMIDDEMAHILSLYESVLNNH